VFVNKVVAHADFKNLTHEVSDRELDALVDCIAEITDACARYLMETPPYITPPCDDSWQEVFDVPWRRAQHEVT
jgi:hypothetical protein